MNLSWSNIVQVLGLPNVPAACDEGRASPAAGIFNGGRGCLDYGQFGQRQKEKTFESLRRFLSQHDVETEKPGFV